MRTRGSRRGASFVPVFFEQRLLPFKVEPFMFGLDKMSSYFFGFLSAVKFGMVSGEGPKEHSARFPNISAS